MDNIVFIDVKEYSIDSYILELLKLGRTWKWTNIKYRYYKIMKIYNLVTHMFKMLIVE